MRTSAAVIIFCLALATGIGAQGVKVSYVDGSASVRRAAAWVDLAVGDPVPANATLRLGESAHLELSAQGAKVILTRAGTYSLGPILSARRAMDAAGVGPSLRAALAYMVRGSSLRQSTAMGVLGSRSPSDEERAARQAERMNQAEADGAMQGSREPPSAAASAPSAAEAAPAPQGDVSGDSQPADSGSGDSRSDDSQPGDSRSHLESGKALIATQQYERAIDELTQALDAAAGEEAAEVRSYLAYAHSMTGDTSAALEVTDGLQPAGSEEWAKDLEILRAKLLLDASAFAEELAWLSRYSHVLSGDPERAPMYYFLTALGHRGKGDIGGEKRNLSKVVSLGPDTELGKTAARMLTMERR